MLNGFSVLDFRLLSPSDEYDLKWADWSRCYEYSYVISILKHENPKTIHNTACGGGNPTHMMFADFLRENFEHVENSDIYEDDNKIMNSLFRNYFKYDICTIINKKYDCVLCISTIEHISSCRCTSCIYNLSRQVSPGGSLIVTFDLPDINIAMIEEMLQKQVSRPSVLLNGHNSACSINSHGSKNIAVLSLNRLLKENV